MVMTLGKSGNYTCVNVMEMKLGDIGKKIVREIKGKIENDGDEIAGVIYFFHIDVKTPEETRKNIKETMLFFNLFSPSRKDPVETESFLIKFQEGESIEKDIIELEPRGKIHGIDGHFKSLWENPLIS
jgi:hypothetical protein